MDTIVAAACGRIVEPAGEHSERVSAVRRKIVQRVLAPILQFIIILTPVLAQCLNASLTSIDVNPRTTKHPPHEVDPIKNTRFRDNNWVDPEGGERL